MQVGNAHIAVAGVSLRPAQRDACLLAAYNNGVQPLYVIITFNPDFGYIHGTFDVSGLLQALTCPIR
jgi:hypothetical protein